VKLGTLLQILYEIKLKWFGIFIRAFKEEIDALVRHAKYTL
jgi:hypothetical protein